MNTKDMSFGEALDWMAANDRKTVSPIGERVRYRVRGGVLEFNSCDDDNGFITSSGRMGWQLDRRWYVVEPKSRIEEAIEREMPERESAVSHNEVRRAMRRVANLALDEAKKVSIDCVYNAQIPSAIEALKVKE